MGAFIVNINLRTDDHETVARELASMKTKEAWVTGAKNGWITVYDGRASSQEEDWIQTLSKQLSKAIDGRAVALMVHDSDFLCYWLFDGGRLVDEFNSCPDYFDDDENASLESQGRADVLLKYCLSGKTIDDVKQVLEEKDRVFADEQLAELAELLGIDGLRAAADFRSIGSDVDAAELDAEFVGTNFPVHRSRSRGLQAPSALKLHDGSDDDEEDDDTPLPTAQEDLAKSVLKMIGLGRPATKIDPLVERLVAAAAENNVGEIDKLVAEGANIDGEAPLRVKIKSGPSPMAARMLGGAGLAFPATPLMAALAHKQVDAVRRLIELGADLKLVHPMFGTPVHAAATSGSVESLRIVLDAGGEVNAKNLQQQTPLQALQYLGKMTSQMGNLAALGAALGRNLQAELEKVMPSAPALAECEQLLRDRGGK